MDGSPYSIATLPMSAEDNFDDEWVSFDGGPIVVLQSKAAKLWLGSDGTNDPRYIKDGEATETDYDFACGEASEGPDGYGDMGSAVARRYDRDMLILDDSSFAARFFILPSGEIGIIQGAVDITLEVIEKTVGKPSEVSWPFEVQDDSLYLMAGVDDLENRVANIVDIPVVPGPKMCHFYTLEYAWIYILRDQTSV